MHPNVGDRFYNKTLKIAGRTSKIYEAPFSGYKVIDVEYPGTDYEIEAYRVDKIEFDSDLKAFVSHKDYKGE